MLPFSDTVISYVSLLNPSGQIINYPEGCIIFNSASKISAPLPVDATALCVETGLNMPVDLNGWHDPSMSFPAKQGETAGQLYKASVPKQHLPETGGFVMLYGEYQRIKLAETPAL